MKSIFFACLLVILVIVVDDAQAAVSPSEKCAEFSDRNYLPTGTFYFNDQCSLRCAYSESKRGRIQQVKHDLNEGKVCPGNSHGRCNKGACVVLKDWQVAGHLDLEIGTLTWDDGVQTPEDNIKIEGFVQACLTNTSAASVNTHLIDRPDFCDYLCFTPLLAANRFRTLDDGYESKFEWKSRCAIASSLVWDPEYVSVVLEFWIKKSDGENRFFGSTRFSPVKEEIKAGKTGEIKQTLETVEGVLGQVTLTHKTFWTPIH